MGREGVMRYATERQLEESEFLELHSYQGQKKSGYLGLCWVDFDFSVFFECPFKGGLQSYPVATHGLESGYSRAQDTNKVGGYP